MKTLIALFFLTPFLYLMSCKDDVAQGNYEYHAHVFKPDNSTKHIGDTMDIEVEFESHTASTIHNINVRIYNAVTNNVVYDKPASSHVIELDGELDFEDQVVLSAVNGFSVGDWVLEAKVWGELDGEQEEIESVAFHIAN